MMDSAEGETWEQIIESEGLRKRKAWRKEEAEILLPYLPTRVRSILDIGCGHFPLLTMWLARHYGGDIEINLMDGDTPRHRLKSPPDKKQTGYRDRMEPWNDVKAAMRYLQTELPGCTLRAFPPASGLTIPADVILSRRSWGHHYPVKTYLDLADRSLLASGRIVLDLRLGKNGLATFAERGFRPVSPNLERRGRKSARLVFARAK